MITPQQMATDLVARLNDILNDFTCDLAEPSGQITAARPLVIGTVRRYFADQINPPRRCLRPGCGCPADVHRPDDNQPLGPDDPDALFRCAGIDGTCACPDYIRTPDPRPDAHIGSWPPVCDLCGHVHTPGERCADHPWRDSCPYRAGRYCGREHLIPDNVPPCGIVGHLGCTWSQCLEPDQAPADQRPSVVRAFDHEARSWTNHRRPADGIWWGFLDPDDPPRHRLGARCTITRTKSQIVVTFPDGGEVIRFGVQRQFRLDQAAGQP